MPKKNQRVIKYTVLKIEKKCLSMDEAWMGICSTKKGISLVVLPRLTEEEVLQTIREHTQGANLEESPQHFENLKKDLLDYFSGRKVEFDYPIDLSHYTPFQSAVFTATRSIPYGETRSYHWIARKIGNPKGSRAVGQALKENSIPILVPCHRVIEQNGKIGGFSPGIKWKEWLLQLEGVLLT